MNNQNDKPEKQSGLTIIELDNDLPTTPITLDEDKLINDTIVSIRKIYGDGVVATQMKIGELIFEKIYGNDLDCFSNDKKLKEKHINKWSIFQKLTEKSNELADKGDQLPKKTFLYNGVKLVIDQKLLSDCLEYKQLSISHKIELLPINDKDLKLAAIKEIKNENLSVREARKRVSLLQKKRDKKASITYYINNPEKIENDPNFLWKMNKAYNTKEKKETVINNCAVKIAELNSLITKSQENVIKLQTLMQEVKKVRIRKTKKKEGAGQTE